MILSPAIKEKFGMIEVTDKIGGDHGTSAWLKKNGWKGCAEGGITKNGNATYFNVDGKTIAVIFYDPDRVKAIYVKKELWNGN